MDKIIHLSAHLPCQTEDAYALFATNQGLENWLTLKADVEPTLGGRYELFWQPDERENNSTIGCKITALHPASLLSFEWKCPVQFKHFANQADPLTHVVVSFTPQADGVIVHLVHSGWRNTPEWEEARLWTESAWGMAFDRLKQLVATPIAS
jgi:hypothetical protein